MDIDDYDEKTNVIEQLSFKSKKEKNDFIYIDYPFEIFGSANAVEKKLPVKITNWLTDISNIEEEDIRIVFYSLNEEALSIQSTFFFLSKLGTRVRKVFFPKNKKEVWDECDVIVTANADMFDDVPNGKKIVLINREFNQARKSDAFLNYNELSEIIEDNNFFKNFINGKEQN